MVGKLFKDHLVYLYSCPNCGSHITDGRLMRGYACLRCLPSEPAEELEIEELIKLLDERKSLLGLSKNKELLDELRRFEVFFEKAVGNKPWSAQKAWAIRVLKKKSFSIVAPTGVGKTVFGLVMSLYLLGRGKAYIILPTTPLVLQAERKLIDFCDKTGVKARILVFHSKMKPKNRKESLEKLEQGDFDILVTTSKFMLKKTDLISKNKFYFMFIDDVDSVLRSGKSIQAVLRLLGLSDDDVSKAQGLIKSMVNLQNEIDRKSRELSAPTNLRGIKKRKRAEELWSELNNLYAKLNKVQEQLNEIKNKINTIMVVSTATGKPRGPKIRLFREVLGFQPGSRPEFLRNIVDTYVISDEDSLVKETIRIVKKLGTGGLVYVPVDKGVDYAIKVADMLRENGIKAEAFYHKNQDALNKFIDGEIDVLVGVAIYYGVMVRGLDLPQRVRYAVFVGFPRFKFSARFEEPHPLNVYRILDILADNAPEPYAEKANAYLVTIRKFIKRASPGMLQMLASRLKSGAPPESDIERFFVQATEFIRSALRVKEVLESLKISKEVVLREEKGNIYIYIPDIMTYIQASGRTSRLYIGGLTKGLSVVIADDERLFRQAAYRLKLIFEGMEWRSFDELEKTGQLEGIMEEIDEDRRRVLKALRGEYVGEKLDLIKTYLMIVESPNKARTISRFFGRPSIRVLSEGLRAYEVSIGNIYLIIIASGGHIYDLATGGWETALNDKFLGAGEILHGVIVRNGNEFVPLYSAIKLCKICGLQIVDPTIDKCPRCGGTVFFDKSRVVDIIRDLALESDVVLIATDPDTEGEKIGWDIAALVRPYAKQVKRVEFHEVTRRAILEALSNWREMNKKQVEAQLVRRIEDRWIGFTLSPILWRDFWLNHYCKKEKASKKDECKQENRKLSAGRVQTPVLGWIISRYEESNKSKKKFYEIVLTNETLIDISEDEVPSKVLEELSEGDKVVIKEVAREKIEITPPPPYTTDTLIYDASRILKFSATYTMSLAQELFELGLITYHRTDSTRVSDTGIAVAREYLQNYNPDLFVPRTWSLEKEGAHEAIRPVRPIDANMLRKMIETGEIDVVRPLTKAHYMLYDLIFRRFIASQSRKAIAVVQTVEIMLPGGATVKRQFYINYEDPGFTVFYMPVPTRHELVPGEYIVERVSAKSRRTVYPYTQGEVVNEMKKRGIGRPSTYAVIVNKLLSRNYVVSMGKAGFLKPTELGEEVYHYLSTNFKDLVSEERTRELEKKMDAVSEGKTDYIEILKDLYEEISRIAKEKITVYPIQLGDEVTGM
jgi:reverse gyrase